MNDDALNGELCRVKRSRVRCAERNGDFRAHAYAALIFHVGGRVEVEHRGRSTLYEGDVHLVPAGDPHRVLGASDADIYGLAICQTCLPPDRFKGVLAPLERVRGGASPVVSLPTNRHMHVLGLLEELEREQSAAASPLVVESLVGLVLTEVSRAASSGAVSTSSGTTLVDGALAFVEQRCLGPLTLKEVAAAVQRSPAHVTTAVKRATGRTVVEWIHEGRLAEARRRLRATDEYVDVIAERVGYADPSHFVRLFRRHHGMAPAAWRRAQRPSS